VKKKKSSAGGVMGKETDEDAGQPLGDRAPVSLTLDYMKDRDRG